VLSLEENPQNPNPPQDINIGSRFRALATLDLNMVTKDQNIDIDMDKDTTSNPVSNPITNSDLVGMEQAAIRVIEARQNSNSNMGDMENIPRGNHREPSTAGHIAAAQETPRPVTIAVPNDFLSLNSARAQHNARPSASEVQASEAGLRPPGPARDAGDTRP